MRLIGILTLLALLSACEWVPHELPSLPGASSSAANDLNATGAIVGVSAIDGSNRATLWSNRTANPVDIGTLGGEESVANAINNNGIVVGWSKTGQMTASGGDVVRAFAWSAATGMFALSTQGIFDDERTAAYAINDSNWVVGTTGIGAAVWRGLTAPLEVAVKNPFLPAAASDVNSSNQVSGWIRSDEQVFLWENGSYTLPYLNNPAEASSTRRGFGMNDESTVVGRVYVPPPPGSQRARIIAAYFPKSKSSILLGDYFESVAHDVNNIGWAVGQANLELDSPGVPFIWWYPEQQEIPSNTELLDAIAGPGLPGSAEAIDDAGNIVGSSQRSDGSLRATYWEIKFKQDDL